MSKATLAIVSLAVSAVIFLALALALTALGIDDRSAGVFSATIAGIIVGYCIRWGEEKAT